MCKLLIMSGLNPKNKKVNWEFIKEMSALMSKHNDDGIGYTAIDKEGKMFGERWWMNWQAFDNRNKMTQTRKKEHDKFASIKAAVSSFINLEDEPDEVPFEKYNSFGELTDEISAITLHARYATSGKEFANTHPFVDLEKDTSLVHNGIINNHSKADELRSTCDSERILNKYLKHEVFKNPSDIQNMVDELKGYFACGIFSRDAEGKRVLDVFKTRARLGGVIIKELNTLVLSTEIDDVKQACRTLGLTVVSKGQSVKDDTLVRFDPITGKVMLMQNYRDNANVYTPPAWQSHNRGYNSFTDSEWEAVLTEREKKAEAEAKAAIDKIIQSNVPNNNTSQVIDWVKLTEDQRTEVVELRKSGMSDEDIAESFNKREVPMLPMAVQEAVKSVIQSKTSVDKIIQEHSTDPMNQVEAQVDGYQLDDTGTMWIYTGVKH